jgi:hypothetical protein
MIFSYVYDSIDADNAVLIFVTSWWAGVKSDEAPRTKDALLVCKQTYAEQEKMQAAAHRRYWTVQKFLLAEGRHTHGRLQRATKADLQHICRLAVCAYIPRLDNVIISFSFKATTAWTVNIRPSEQMNTTVGSQTLVNEFRLNNLQRMFKNMMESWRYDYAQDDYRSVDMSPVDPISGKGLDARELECLPFKIQRSRYLYQ